MRAIFLCWLLSFSLCGAEYCSTCTRDENGRIHRSSSARAEFKRAQPCPVTGASVGACPGYVIDHVMPLACGGQDRPENMQWQAIADAKAKDAWELIGCAR